MAKIPVGDTINYAYTFTFGNILTILGLTWLPLLISAAISYYTMTLWFSWIGKLPIFGPDAHPDPQAVVSMLSDMGGAMALGFLTMLVSLFMTAIVGVAVTMQALGLRTGTPYIHIAAGAPEWRVFGGYIRWFFAILGVYFITAIGFMLAFFLAAAISPQGSGSALGGIVAGIICIALLCLALLTIVRMSFLLVPSIVAEPGKGGLARSYHLTRGNFWRIVIVFIVLVLPIALVTSAVQGAFIGNPFIELLGHLQPGMNPEQQMQEFRQAMIQWMQALQQAFLPMAIIGFISSVFMSGLLYGGAAYAYRALAGTPDAAPAPAPTA